MKEFKDWLFLLCVVFTAVMLFAFSMSKAFSMTFSQAQRVYYTVAQKNGIRPPKLLLNPTREINAGYTGSHIYVNQGLLNSVINEDELAMNLAHELAHFKLWHLGGSTPSKELAADRLGFTFLVRAGYGGCKGLRWRLRYGQASSTHPSGRERYNRLCGGKR